jgi:hypothetical protein
LTAEASIDGSPFRAAPRFVKVEPGDHRIEVRAEGYESATRRVRLARGGIAALSFTLEPEPAELILTGAEDATVHIDGQRVTVPADGSPLRVSPGHHFLAVTQTGFRPFGQPIDLRVGERRVLEVDLEATGQHAAAVVMLATGGAGVTTGIILGALSVAADRSGRTDDAGALRVGSGIAGVTGVLVLVGGGTLLMLDEPDVPRPGESASSTSLTITPLMGPESLGAGLSLTF